MSKDKLLSTTASVDLPRNSAAPARDESDQRHDLGDTSQPRRIPKPKPREHHRRHSDRSGGDGDDDSGGGDGEPDSLVPDPRVQAELSVTKMTLHRWDNDPKTAPRMAALGWPPKVIVNGRCYRFRSQLEAFKQTLMRQAIADRAARHAARGDAA
jgi:hypothetical protein